MKNLFLVGVISLISLSTFAQNVQKYVGSDRVTFGAKAGTTFATISQEDTKSITSFYVGGVVNILFSEVFTFQPGLTLVGKGFKKTTSSSLRMPSSGDILNVTSSFKASPWYLEIPMNAVFNFQAGAGKIFVGGGPYVDLALFGDYERTIKQTNTFTGSYSSKTKIDDIDFGEQGGMSSIDFGMNFLLGYQLKNGLSVNAGYGLGLTNNYENLSSKNKVFSLGLGFAF